MPNLLTPVHRLYGRGAGTPMPPVAAVVAAILQAALKSSLAGGLFSRASTATVTDFEGIVRTCKIGEARFVGSRRVENLLSSNLNDWTFQSGSGTVIDTVDPFGNTGTGAKRVTTTSANDFFQISKPITVSIRTSNRCWIKVIAGAGAVRFDNRNVAFTLSGVLLDGNWHLVNGNNNATSSVGVLYNAFRIASVGGSIEIWQPQVEAVGGQANINPSEYVSNGIIRVNYFTFTEGTRLKYINPAGVTDAITTITGFYNSLQFTQTGVVNYAYKSFTGILGRTYNLAVYVEMDDGLAPLPGANTAGKDFSFVAYGSFVNPAYTVTLISGNIYRISADIVKNGANTNWGMVKYSSQSNRGFRVTGYQISKGQNERHYQKITDASSIDFGNYHSGGVDGVQYFTTQNGNTVAGNIITEATGTIIPTATEKGVLIEPQVTNLILQSEDLSSATWTKRGAVVLTTDNTPSPDGLSTADKVDALTTAGVNDIYQIISGLTAGTTYSPSVWIKKITSTGTLIIADPTTGTGKYSINLALLGIGWENITRDHPAVTVVTEFTPTGVSSGIQYYSTGNLSLYIWGAKFEAGKVPHSYLKTITTGVTKPADDLRYAAIANFPVTAVSIAMTVTSRANGADYGGSNGRLFGTNDSRGTNNELRTFITNAYSFVAIAGGGYFNLIKIDIVRNTAGRYGFTLKQNGANIDWQIAKDGVLKGSGSVVGMLDHSNTGDMQIGNWNGGYFSGSFKDVVVYDVVKPIVSFLADTVL